MAAAPELSVFQRLAQLPKREQKKFYQGLSGFEQQALLHSWKYRGRPSQQPPPLEQYIWLIMTGRGWGKSRTLSEWVHLRAELQPGSLGGLIARTSRHTRDVIVNGESGVLATQKPWNAVTYSPSNSLLTWANGTRAHLYSSEEPDDMRGPNHNWFGADELATFTKKNGADGGMAWDQIQLSTRKEHSGIPPQICIATTPRPTQVMRGLRADKRVLLTVGKLLDNAANLSPQWMEAMKYKYEGTRLGRQELEGELLDLVEGALWSLDQFDEKRILEEDPIEVAERCQRVVVSIDPAVTSGDDSDSTGITVAGAGYKGDGFVLADRTCRLSPAGWARRAVEAFDEFDADCIIGEVNNGGDLVEANIRTVRRDIPYRAVRASRGKHVRAEPVAALYEQNRISHVGRFETLEDQLTRFTVNGYEGDDSPDEADSAIWGLWDLLIDGQEEEPDHYDLSGGERKSHWR